MRNDNEPALSTESEKRAHEKISEIFNRACPGCRILTNVIVPTGRDISASPATAEYDLIVVWQYGVIHFEVKGWRGSYLFRELEMNGRSKWFMRFPGPNHVEERENALKQCVSKTRLLREQLGFWTQHYVLFTDNMLDLAPDMSCYLVTLREATMLPRIIRNRHKEVGERILDQRTIDAIADALLEVGAGLTPEIHLTNVMKYVEARKVREDAKKNEEMPIAAPAISKAEKMAIKKQRSMDRQIERYAASQLLSRLPVPNPVDMLLGQYPYWRLTQGDWYTRPHQLPVAFNC